MAGSAARRRRQFRKYRSLLRRWVWFVLVCAVIAAGSAYVVTKRQAPTYRASTLLIVDQRTPGGDAYSNLLASDQLVQTYLSLIATPSVLEEATRQIGGVSAADLAARVRVSNPGISTQILQVQVDDRDPRRAARLANAIATSFITLQQQTAAHEFHNASQQLHQQFAGVSERLSALTNRINAIQAANPNDPRLATLRANWPPCRGTATPGSLRTPSSCYRRLSRPTISVCSRQLFRPQARLAPMFGSRWLPPGWLALSWQQAWCCCWNSWMIASVR